MSTIADLATVDRTARMLLSMFTEPNDARTGQLLRKVGGVETLRLALSEKAAPGMNSVDTQMWRGHIDTGADPESLAHRLRAFEHGGVAVLIPGDQNWPRGLNDLGDRAPCVLWARGATSLLRVPLTDAVTITGARAATSYGEHVAHELASELAASERAIFSGASYGIDGIAQRAALTVGGYTVTVTVGGIDRPYPAGYRELLKQIRDLGFATSELPPDATPTKWRLLARNRVLASVSGATVIVEAAYRSGSLDVAARAAEMGRPMGAVPGPVTSVASSGTYRLIREGPTRLVTDAQDVIEMLGGSQPSVMLKFGPEPGLQRPKPQVERTL